MSSERFTEDQSWEGSFSPDVQLDLDQLLEKSRGYLAAVANQAIGPTLKAKISASDLLQQTYLDAHRNVRNFRGRSEAELKAWLRRILMNNIITMQRSYDTQKRDRRRECQNVEVDQIRGRDKTPSTLVAQDEEMRLLFRALQGLSVDYQRVIRMRNLDRKSWREIGNALDRSEDAARSLWLQAMKSLKAQMGKIQSDAGLATRGE